MTLQAINNNMKYHNLEGIGKKNQTSEIKKYYN